jgi:hypothetical protein
VTSTVSSSSEPSTREPIAGYACTWTMLGLRPVPGFAEKERTERNDEKEEQDARSGAALYVGSCKAR